MLIKYQVSSINTIIIFNILSIHDKIMCPNLATKLLCPKNDGTTILLLQKMNPLILEKEGKGLY